MHLSQLTVHREFGKWVFLLTTIAICVLMGVIRYYAPYICDDSIWINRWQSCPEFKDSGVYILRSFKWILNCYFLEYDMGINTGRLSDLSTPLTLALMPNWLISGITVVALAVMFYRAILMSRIQSLSLWQSALVVILLLELLPWFNGMALRIFSINYIWSSALVLTTVCYIFGISHCHKRWSYAIVCIISLLAGTMHEGFSITVIGGLIGCLTIHAIQYKKFLLSKKQLILAILFTVGSLMPLLSPAMLARFNNCVVDDTFRTLQALWWVYEVPMGMYVLCSITFIIFTLKKGRKVHDIDIFLLIATILGMIVYWKIYVGFRVAWFGMIFCIIGSCRLIRYLIGPLYGRKKQVAEIIGFASLILIVIQLSGTVYWQKRFSDQYDKIVREYSKSSDGIVFIDNLISHNDIPLWADIHIAALSIYDPSFYISIKQNRQINKRCGILPMNLYNRKFDFSDSNEFNQIPVKGGYVIPRLEDVKEGKLCNIVQKFSDWYDEVCQATFINFENRHGQQLTFVQVRYHINSENHHRTYIELPQ